jgi:outer membrane immunogenic protein
MKRFATSLICATMFAAMASAQAADMPIKAPVLKAAPYDPWTGTYIGGNAGYSWGDWKSTNPVPGNTLAGIGFGNFGPGLTSTAKPNVDGWVAGAQIGHNWHIQPNWVVGLEGDFQWTGEKARNAGSGVLLNIPFGDGRLIISDTSANSWKLDWFSTVRARGGFLVAPTWLWYGTGGLAVGRASYTNTSTLSAAQNFTGGLSASLTTSVGESKTQAGWTLGTGIENQFAKNWSAKLEYLYIDLGSHRFLNLTGFDTNIKLRDNIVRAGLNYQFH